MKRDRITNIISVVVLFLASLITIGGAFGPMLSYMNATAYGFKYFTTGLYDDIKAFTDAMKYSFAGAQLANLITHVLLETFYISFIISLIIVLIAGPINLVRVLTGKAEVRTKLFMRHIGMGLALIVATLSMIYQPRMTFAWGAIMILIPAIISILVVCICYIARSRVAKQYIGRSLMFLSVLLLFFGTMFGICRQVKVGGVSYSGGYLMYNFYYELLINIKNSLSSKTYVAYSLSSLGGLLLLCGIVNFARLTAKCAHFGNRKQGRMIFRYIFNLIYLIAGMVAAMIGLNQLEYKPGVGIGFIAFIVLFVLSFALLIAYGILNAKGNEDEYARQQEMAALPAGSRPVRQKKVYDRRRDDDELVYVPRKPRPQEEYVEEAPAPAPVRKVAPTPAPARRVAPAPVEDPAPAPAPRPVQSRPVPPKKKVRRDDDEIAYRK